MKMDVIQMLDAFLDLKLKNLTITFRTKQYSMKLIVDFVAENEQSDWRKH